MESAEGFFFWVRSKKSKITVWGEEVKKRR